MSQSQSQNPYASPSQLGVRPGAALSAGFLSQCVRLDVRRAAADRGGVVRRPAAARPCSTPPRSGTCRSLIGQIVLVDRDQRRDQQSSSASAALGLFFVYAALMGVDPVVHLHRLRTGLDRRRVRQRGRRCSVPQRSTARSPSAIARLDRRLPVHGPDRDHRRVGREPVPAPERAIGLVISVVGVVLFVGLTAYDVQRITRGDLRRATPARWRRARSSGRCHSTSTSSTSSCSCSGSSAAAQLDRPSPGARRPMAEAAADRRADLRPRRDLVGGRPGRRDRSSARGASSDRGSGRRGSWRSSTARRSRAPGSCRATPSSRSRTASRRSSPDGHEIGCHGWAHEDLAALERPSSGT